MPTVFPSLFGAVLQISDQKLTFILTPSLSSNSFLQIFEDFLLNYFALILLNLVIISSRASTSAPQRWPLLEWGGALPMMSPFMMMAPSACASWLQPYEIILCLVQGLGWKVTCCGSQYYSMLQNGALYMSFWIQSVKVAISNSSSWCLGFWCIARWLCYSELLVTRI